MRRKSKETLALEELQRIDQELWSEIFMLATSLANRRKAKDKLSKFSNAPSVKTVGEYILRLRELIERLQQMRLEGKVEKLREVLNKPPVEMPESLDEVLAQRIIRLLAASEHARKETLSSDLDIATFLKADLKNVQQELVILHVNGLIEMEADLLPYFSARITDDGRAKARLIEATPKTKSIH
jgi:hypothetical protein